MHLVVISTYELGHQPLHAALAVAALKTEGHQVTVLDLSVESWDEAPMSAADAVAIAVPMHTALRLGVDVVKRIRRHQPAMPIALFGLYATVDAGLEGVTTIAGEYLPALLDWARHAGRPASGRPIVKRTGSPQTTVPVRHQLPPLDRYAQLVIGDQQLTAGYVESSRGCRHRCRHCPVPVVYDGRISIVDVATVLADVDQQVAAGARHITFGDPDFLNAPAHARRVVTELHSRHPQVSFDITVKVEHILGQASLWPEFAAAGCLFVISAFETLNDDILERLDKGHTAAEAGKAVHLLREHGIEIRPSWLLFTPWTTMRDLVDVFRFITDHDLVDNTDPVQLAIRLLVPTGSLLLDSRDAATWYGDYHPELLTYQWSSGDPRLDRLQADLLAIAEAHATAPARVAVAAMWERVAAVAGVDPTSLVIPQGATRGVPRMTEPWFC